MSTQINITVDSGGLTDRAKQQQQAARQAQLEKERTLNLSAEALDKRAVAQAAKGQSLNGQPLYTASFKQLQIDRRPAVNRQGGRGILGFIDVEDAYASVPPVDEAYVASNKINTDTVITYRKGKYVKYGVIRVVVARPLDSCVTSSDLPSSYFLNKETELYNFILAGGVVWVSNEYVGCGIESATFNSYLFNIFGTTMGFVDDEQPEGSRVYIGPFSDPNYGVIRSPLLDVSKIETSPAYFYNALTCSISGGTPYYGNSNGVVCAYEKIGKGFLVLSGDQNGTAQYPSYSESGPNFVAALRSLSSP